MPTWKEKLHPKRFDGMSGKMAAIVGYILDEALTNPAINELVVTSDGFVLAQHDGDVGDNDFMGSGIGPASKLEESSRYCGSYARRAHRSGSRLPVTHTFVQGCSKVRRNGTNVFSVSNPWSWQ